MKRPLRDRVRRTATVAAGHVRDGGPVDAPVREPRAVLPSTATCPASAGAELSRSARAPGHTRVSTRRIVEVAGARRCRVGRGRGCEGGQGLLRGIAGPLADGQVGAGSGQHRAGRGQQHRHQRVPTAPLVTRVGQCRQPLSDVEQFALARQGRLGQADGDRLAAPRGSGGAGRLGRSPRQPEPRCLRDGPPPPRHTPVTSNASRSPAL